MLDVTGFANTFWDEMCDLYRNPSVSELCLKLQNTHDVDVPLFLLLVLADRRDMACSKDGFERFLADAALWREDVVRPLRTIRQNMKTRYVTADELRLREAVKSVELQAERVHVSRLAGSLLAHAGCEGVRALSDSYLTLCGVPDDKRTASLAKLADVPDLNVGTTQQ